MSMATFGRVSVETLRSCCDETVWNVVDQHREFLIDDGDSMISSLRQLCIDRSCFQDDVVQRCYFVEKKMRPPAENAPKHETLTLLAASPSAAAVSHFGSPGGSSSRSGDVTGIEEPDETKQFDVRRRWPVDEGESSDWIQRANPCPGRDPHHSRDSMTSHGEQERRRDRSLSDESFAPPTVVSGDQSPRRSNDAGPITGRISSGVAVDEDLANGNTITDISRTPSEEVVEGQRGCKLSRSRAIGDSSEMSGGDSTRGGCGDPDNDWEVLYFSLVMQGAVSAAGDGSRKALSIDRVSMNRCEGSSGGGGGATVSGCNCKRFGVEVSSRPRLNFRKMQRRRHQIRQSLHSINTAIKPLQVVDDTPKSVSQVTTWRFSPTVKQVDPSVFRFIPLTNNRAFVQ